MNILYFEMLYIFMFLLCLCQKSVVMILCTVQTLNTETVVKERETHLSNT
jgi:hypothetical protein